MTMIRKLSTELIAQIAAGEVVERPASAVKELVENSIDAGARSITVELRDGGISYLRVSDNGKGIPGDQVKMAFERHATSKINTAGDLFDLHTLGFRGEALASIAAVAKVTCTTRTADADYGMKAVVEGGTFSDFSQAASPVGTTILVENLFFNTPVRLKFLKKPAAEASMVTDYMLRLILSHPEISFRYVSQGKTVYRSAGDGKIESALYSLYGSEAVKQMHKVHGHMNGLLLDGYVGVGELSRGNRLHESFFVNGRFFRSETISKALEAGCEGRVMVGRFPMCSLSLGLPSQQVDVNVHPNKLEVRFQNEAAIASALECLVYDALHEDSISSQFTDSTDERADILEKTEKPAMVLLPVSVPHENVSQKMQASPIQETSPSQIPLPEEKDRTSSDPGQSGSFQLLHTNVHSAAASFHQEPKNTYDIQASPVHFGSQKMDSAAPAEPSQNEEQIRIPAEVADVPLAFVGIAFHTYWIFESGDKLLWVDQHAAHERILYDRLIGLYEKEVISQPLLSPVLVKLSPSDMQLADEFLPLLSSAGFMAEVFDGRSVALHAIPTLFGENADPTEMFMDALSEWQAGKSSVTRDRIRARVAQMACKHAIKGGDALSEAEMDCFVKDILSSNSIPTCPHGRPIVITTDRYTIEKRFKRIQ